MDRLIQNFFNLEIMGRYLSPLIEGFFVTLKLAALVVVSGLLLGIILATLRAFQVKPANALIVLFVDFFRALPPLVILIVLYFAFPYINIQMSGFLASWLSLTLVLAAFSEEIFWAGILSVEKGQWEAARSTGLTFFQALRYVVFSQALRLTLPPLTNRAIAITKGTALASVVAVPEILNQASSAQALAGNASPLTMAAMAYLLIFVPLVIFSRWLESRFAWKH